jgi:hypothetical protein
MLVRGLVAAGLGLLLVPATASADFLDYTLNETNPLLGVTSGAVTTTVDKINGAYTERITFASDPTAGPTTFTATAYADFTQYLRNDGTIPVFSNLSVVGDPTASKYGLYAVFTSSGNFNGSFSGTAATITFYADVDLNTTKALGSTGSDPIVRGNTADDLQILSTSNLIAGFGSAFAAGGFFDLTFLNPTFTAFGASYWQNLPIINLVMNPDGDLDLLTATPVAGSPYTFQVTGDVSNVFQVVPEPATLTLLGFGLAGARWASRRRKGAVQA